MEVHLSVIYKCSLRQSCSEHVGLSTVLVCAVKRCRAGYCHIYIITITPASTWSRFSITWSKNKSTALWIWADVCCCSGQQALKLQPERYFSDFPSLIWLWGKEIMCKMFILIYMWYVQIMRALNTSWRFEQWPFSPRCTFHTWYYHIIYYKATKWIKHVVNLFLIPTTIWIYWLSAFLITFLILAHLLPAVSCFMFVFQ